MPEVLNTAIRYRFLTLRRDKAIVSSQHDWARWGILLIMGSLNLTVLLVLGRPMRLTGRTDPQRNARSKHQDRT